MVRRLVLVAALLVASSSSVLAVGRCSKGSEFGPPLCPLALPPIQRVVIDENGAKSSLEPDASVDCSNFILSERMVRRYLARAKLVPAGAGHSTLDWSACHATGSMLFKNGKSARWEISQFRVGSLIRDGQLEEILLCPTCKERPFDR